jgi:hypothetical protein
MSIRLDEISPYWLTSHGTWFSDDETKMDDTLFTKEYFIECCIYFSIRETAKKVLEPEELKEWLDIAEKKWSCMDDTRTNAKLLWEMNCKQKARLVDRIVKNCYE